MRTIESFRSSANESTAFANGYTDGQTARATQASLTAYVRVGIDDYARGYRAGYFARSSAVTTTASETPIIPRHVANL